MNCQRAAFYFTVLTLIPGASLLPAADTPLLKTRMKLESRQPVKIVCLGDSVTGIYYHSGGMRAYPEMIEIGLKKLDPAAKVTVINSGISGQSTVDGLNRLQKDVLDQKPDLVTVMFGLNDIVRVPQPDFEANLKTMVAKCREIGAEVMFCTPNGIYETPGRPISKLEDYNQAMKAVAAETKSAFCDIYGAYQAVKAQSELEFRLLCSDPFHPNMDGHKLNAEMICESITGKKVSLSEVGPPTPALAHVAKKVAEGKPIHVHAMTPFDKWIGAALKSQFPNAEIIVTPWKIEGETIVQLHVASQGVRALNPRPDLVVVAIPLEVTPLLSKPEEVALADYVWTMNFALSFGLQEWDVIGIAPSVLHAKLSDADQDRENFARRMINAQHIDLITRPQDNTDEPSAVLTEWMKRLKQE